MKRPVLSKTVFLNSLVLCFIFTNQPVNAKTMYRWVDENGKVSFSDQVPPSKVELKRDELDKNANVIKVTEKAKTKAELDLEKRLESLKKQQEKIILEQKGRDKKLLSSFLNITTMDESYKKKMDAFKSQEYEMANSLKKRVEELTVQQKEAADYEIKNKKTPSELLDNIEASQKEIAKTRQDIKQLQLKKAQFQKEFEVDRARFLYLTKINAATIASANPSPAPLPDDAPNVQKAVSELGLFSCNDADQCEKAWSIAKEFVRANSSTKINTDTDKLVMTDDPTATDISLSVSKIISEDKKQQLFLDIRCQDSVPGKELCAGAKAQGFRLQFSNYIETQLNLSLKPDATAVPAPPTTAPAKK